MSDACEGVMAILAIAFWVLVFRFLWRRVIRPVFHLAATGIKRGWQWLMRQYKENVEKYSG